MAINLITSYYTSEDDLRQAEIDTCLRRNILNKSIDNVFVLTNDELPFEKDNLFVIRCKLRPTYNDLFRVTQRRLFETSNINIIANADIYFESDIEELLKYDLRNTCLALSRWDVTNNGTYHHASKESQDTWIFEGAVKTNTDGWMQIGIKGCDNRIAHELHNVGYKVINPSKLIKSYHLHSSDVRSDDKSIIEGPYLFISPTDTPCYYPS